MNLLDKQIMAVTASLRTYGGVVGIDPEAPEFLQCAFLEMMRGCPDCRKAVSEKHNTDE